MCGVATRLIELVPGTEPPLGFDRRVLARVQDVAPSSRSAGRSAAMAGVEDADRRRRLVDRGGHGRGGRGGVGVRFGRAGSWDIRITPRPTG